jgi:hypothetical protein
MSENKVVQLIQKATEPDIKAIEFVEKILDLCKEGKLKSGCYHLIQELDAKLKWGA